MLEIVGGIMDKSPFTAMLERLLLMKTADGTAQVFIRIGAPVVDGAGWKCPVAIDGLFGRLVDAPGFDSMSAMEGAFELVHTVLRKSGNQFLFPAENDEDPEPYPPPTLAEST
jgi:hypothetical protein